MVRFYEAPWQGDRSAGRSVGVRLSGEQGGRAGLLLGAGGRDPRWYAVLLEGNRLSLVARHPDSLEIRATADLPGGWHPEGELLQVSETGSDVTVVANGQRVFSLPRPNDATLLDGPVGIIAAGPGRSVFHDFAFAGPVTAPGGMDERLPTANDDRLPTAGEASKPGRKEEPPTAAPTPTPTPTTFDASKYPERALDIVGAYIFIMYHEYGHFMAGELKLPVVGPEEDMADEFAAQSWVQAVREHPALMPLALGGAKFWMYTSKQAKASGQEAPWYDEHAPDERRFASMLCTLYGAFPDNFGSIIDNLKLPDYRRRGCIEMAARRGNAWKTLLRPYRRANAAVNPGDAPADAKGGRVTVDIQPSKTNDGALIYNTVANAGFDKFMNGLSSVYVLPRDTKFVMRDCGTINSFYTPRDGSVTLCYEMLSYINKLFNAYEGDNAATPASTSSGGQTLTGLLSGAWHLQLSGKNGVKLDGMFVFRPDSSYTSSITAAGTTERATGSWSVAADESHRIVLTLQRQSGQRCARGGCRQMSGGEPQRIPLTPVNHDTLRLGEAGTLTRLPQQ